VTLASFFKLQAIGKQKASITVFAENMLLDLSFGILLREMVLATCQMLFGLLFLTMNGVANGVRKNDTRIRLHLQQH